ncbi:YceD family protein [Pseudonocardia sp. HH130630-07]|uniref:YceD family protein n=1 Tax=Pseudonocardia sp. HH130630-07 TaxID=1690815 RepID=UPI0008150A0A|nr:YceD family protein [Pseudonocardia sp. HH130630-07]ANY08212.1 metal-binding protein [Pseudonocardia sp. HH130630-07]
MNTQHTHGDRAHDNPWVLSTRELARRPGNQRTVRRTVPAPSGDEIIGLAEVIAVPGGSDVELDLSLESVTEGVYVSGTATARLEGECSRCLDPIVDDVEIRIGELFAYPDSATEETTDADEIPRLVDERIDITQTVRDAVVTDLPMAPLCREDCPGLCADCGERWVDLPTDHGHERLDPRWAALQERLPSTD